MWWLKPLLDRTVGRTGIGGKVFGAMNMMQQGVEANPAPSAANTAASGSATSAVEQMWADINSPVPVGGVEGNNFMDLLLKLKYPYLF